MLPKYLINVYITLCFFCTFCLYYSQIFIALVRVYLNCRNDLSKLYINSTVETTQIGRREKFVYLFVLYKEKIRADQRFFLLAILIENVQCICNWQLQRNKQPKPIKSNWITCWTNSLWFRLNRIHSGCCKSWNTVFLVGASKSILSIESLNLLETNKDAADAVDIAINSIRYRYDATMCVCTMYQSVS